MTSQDEPTEAPVTGSDGLHTVFGFGTARHQNVVTKGVATEVPDNDPEKGPQLATQNEPETGPDGFGTVSGKVSKGVATGVPDTGTEEGPSWLNKVSQIGYQILNHVRDP